MKKDLAISIIGTGNVAWHLAHSFRNANVTVEFIIGRNEEQGKLLAQKVGAEFTSDFNVTLKASSILLISISDTAVEDIARTIKSQDIILAHTSGSLPLSILDNHKNSGVFYPFQTFTKNVHTGQIKFPVCIEGKNESVEEALKTLANKISDQVVILPSEKRKTLHLSGVLANNFTNHLYSQTFDFLEGNGIDNTLLIPILEETLAKLRSGHPKELQTGPARRGDMEIVKKHLALLKAHPSLSTIYEVMSNSIVRYYQ